LAVGSFDLGSGLCADCVLTFGLGSGVGQSVLDAISQDESRIQVHGILGDFCRLRVATNDLRWLLDIARYHGRKLQPIPCPPKYWPA